MVIRIALPLPLAPEILPSDDMAASRALTARAAPSARGVVHLRGATAHRSAARRPSAGRRGAPVDVKAFGFLKDLGFEKPGWLPAFNKEKRRKEVDELLASGKPVVVGPDYTVGAAFVGAGSLLNAVHLAPLGVPIALLGGFFAFQAARVSLPGSPVPLPLTSSWCRLTSNMRHLPCRSRRPSRRNPSIRSSSSVLRCRPCQATHKLTPFTSSQVKFVFDSEAMEVRIGEDLRQSGENFAVGGENRWKYDTFTNWTFFPANSSDGVTNGKFPFPILVYFKETQTPKENWTQGPGGFDKKPGTGQIHFFPAVVDAQEIAYLFEKKGCARQA